MPESETAPITCRVTKWYYKRMGLMFLMLVAMACWFVYDAAIGWPKKQEIHRRYIQLKEAGKLEQWRDEARENNWDSQPEEYSDEKIEQQWHWAYGVFVLAGIVVVVFLCNRNKKLTADAKAFFTPSGKRIAFTDVFCIDRRKWDHKGLAYAYYRENGGPKKKTTIDDLKYGGADRVLERLLNHFEGDIIDRVADEDDDADDAGSPPPQGQDRDQGPQVEDDDAAAGDESGKT